MGFKAEQLSFTTSNSQSIHHRIRRLHVRLILSHKHPWGGGGPDVQWHSEQVSRPLVIHCSPGFDAIPRISIIRRFHRNLEDELHLLHLGLAPAYGGARHWHRCPCAFPCLRLSFVTANWWFLDCLFGDVDPWFLLTVNGKVPNLQTTNPIY